ncbi:MAG: hypothetical protein U0836_14540 [Pirellulales bacterium]
MKPSFSLKWLFVGVAAVGRAITGMGGHFNDWMAQVTGSMLIAIGIAAHLHRLGRRSGLPNVEPRWSLRILLISTTMICIALAAAITALPRSVSFQTVKSVRPGMSLKEARTLLGSHSWGGGHLVVNGFRQGGSMHYSHVGRAGLWECVVHYDGGDRVTDVYVYNRYLPEWLAQPTNW